MIQNIKLKKYYISINFLIFSFFISLSIFAQELPEKPIPKRLVNDFTTTL